MRSPAAMWDFWSLPRKPASGHHPVLRPRPTGRLTAATQRMDLDSNRHRGPARLHDGGIEAHHVPTFTGRKKFKFDTAAVATRPFARASAATTAARSMK